MAFAEKLKRIEDKITEGAKDDPERAGVGVERLVSKDKAITS